MLFKVDPCAWHEHQSLRRIWHPSFDLVRQVTENYAAWAALGVLGLR